MVWPHPRDVIQYARLSYYYDNMFIVCLLYDILFDFKTCFGPINSENCLNVCHNITFLDVTSTCFCLWFHVCNSLYVTLPQKQVADVSLVLKDSEPQFVDPVFCIRWPENGQL